MVFIFWKKKNERPVSSQKPDKSLWSVGAHSIILNSTFKYLNIASLQKIKDGRAGSDLKCDTLQPVRWDGSDLKSDIHPALPQSLQKQFTRRFACTPV